MATLSEYILGDTMIEVGAAGVFQESTRHSKVVKCDNQELQMKILMTNPEDILVVKSKINSPKNIISVETYEDSLKEL